jgi:hypothetical protein
VITVKLADNAVTGAKIAAEAVTASKIAAGAVTAAKIAAGAVTAAKIAAGAITADKLAATIILTGTLWAGANRVKLDNRGITVYGESLGFYDGGANAGGVAAVGNSLGIVTAGDLIFSTTSSDRSIALAVGGGYKMVVANSGIVLNQRLYAVGLYVNLLYDIIPYNTTTWLGASGTKFARGYFTQLPGCPMPTSNSGVRVLKKINNPKVMDGNHGTRHYFLDEDFPSEMKCKVATKTADGRVVETEEEEIEYIRTLGVLVQATREIISRIETLEKEVLGHAKDPEDY